VPYCDPTSQLTPQPFDDLLERTVRAPRLSGSRVKELSELAMKYVAEDHEIVASLLRLNNSLPAASTQRVSSLYVFDAIAREAKRLVDKGVGRTVSTERGKGTQAGLLAKMEGVVDSWVAGMLDDGSGGTWAEGRVSFQTFVIGLPSPWASAHKLAGKDTQDYRYLAQGLDVPRGMHCPDPGEHSGRRRAIIQR